VAAVVVEVKWLRAHLHCDGHLGVQ
jgi:hypothetical protein